MFVVSRYHKNCSGAVYLINQRKCGLFSQKHVSPSTGSKQWNHFGGNVFATHFLFFSHGQLRFNVQNILTEHIPPATGCVLADAESKWELNLDAGAFWSAGVIQIRDSLMLKALHNHIPDPESGLKVMTQGVERK